MRFLKRRTIIITVVMFFVAIQLYSHYQQDKVTTNPLSRFVLSITYYPQQIITSGTNRLVSVWNNYLDLVNVKEENQKLRKEINTLHLENFKLSEVRAQNERLKKLLNFKETSLHPVVSANIIGASPSILRSQVVIVDKGSGAGVVKGMPVASYQGIVGRILVTGENSSEVLLVTDPVSAVDAYVHRTRARGIVKGTGTGCVMQYIEKKSDVSIGDKIISSGKDGFFPKGVIVGTVTAIEPDGSFMAADVTPEVDLSSLEEVVIIFKNVDSIVLND